jgi:hypothetical protein
MTTNLPPAGWGTRFGYPTFTEHHASVLADPPPLAGHTVRFVGVNGTDYTTWTYKPKAV